MPTLANQENERFFLQLIAEDKFKVTREGRAFNLVTGREIGISSRTYGYKTLCLTDSNSKRTRSYPLHRLIWVHFNGPINPELQINHKNGNKLDNRIENLEVCTQQKNELHSYKVLNKQAPKGENHGRSKFTDEEVIYYRKLFKEHRITVKEIARTKDCSKGAIYCLLKGITYKHLNT